MKLDGQIPENCFICFKTVPFHVIAPINATHLQRMKVELPRAKVASPRRCQFSRHCLPAQRALKSEL
ncbi:MAG: hypothetical protein CMM01_25280 [Rhodopirellula sp.]|nr:hypothetical protein [Rhodopirellula sp.]